MCGIAGIIRFDGRPACRASLEAAVRALRHRGPDDAGTWCEGPVGIGATRLAVMDPSLAGHQPMSRGDGRYHLVFNGEIYNFRELRHELRGLGETFHTETDTEVLLAALIRWGTAALDKLNGMWAFAFHDLHINSGFLARDRFGVKPLFYSTDERQLAFASELSAWSLLGAADHGINEEALVEHLSFGFISGQKTIFRGAKRLEPGSLIAFDGRAVGRPTRFYDPIDRVFADGRSTQSDNTLNGQKADASRSARRLLSESVVRRRVADVPMGAFLSGGLDSSIIVSHLAEACGTPIKTFSLGYADQASYDETSFARLVADRFGTDHHEWRVTEPDILSAIPALLDHLGEPLGDSSIIPTALVSRLARRHVTVALSGDGGDELFGGYSRYLAHASFAALERLPRWMRAWVLEPAARWGRAHRSGAVGNRVRQLGKLLRGEGLKTIERHVAWSRILSPEAEAAVFGISDGASRATEAQTWLKRCEAHMLELGNSLSRRMIGMEPLCHIMALDIGHQLPADMLHKVDLASMLHSLEVRTPFLDPQVVEFALALSADRKIRGGVGKRLLVEAYRGHLPDEVLDRGKRGFEVPIGEYFRGPLKDWFHEVVTRNRVESVGLISYPGVQRIFAEHLERKADHADLLFALLSLCHWLGRR